MLTKRRLENITGLFLLLAVERLLETGWIYKLQLCYENFRAKDKSLCNFTM